MKKEIEINYIAHNGSTQLKSDIIDFLPCIGSSFVIKELKSNSCSGFFITTEANCEIINDKYICTVTAIEGNYDIYERGLREMTYGLTI